MTPGARRAAGRSSRPASLRPLYPPTPTFATILSIQVLELPLVFKSQIRNGVESLVWREATAAFVLAPAS